MHDHDGELNKNTNDNKDKNKNSVFILSPERIKNRGLLLYIDLGFGKYMYVTIGSHRKVMGYGHGKHV